MVQQREKLTVGVESHRMRSTQTHLGVKKS